MTTDTVETVNDLGLNWVKPINRDKIEMWEFEQLWERVRSADYAFEDTTRNSKERFAASMIEANTYNFELPEKAFIQLANCFPLSNAVIHFVTYQSVHVGQLIDAASEVFGFAFDKVGVHRLTAYIPDFNGKAKRLAPLMRMKFEGQMRKSFLYESKWYDIEIFGLLDVDWQKRGRK